MKAKAKPVDTTKCTISSRRDHTTVWVTFDKVGFHCYPDAPEEVAYLKDRHRHVFKFFVEITVTHDDREIEFHMLKNWITSLYDHGALEVDHKSCEMLANDLLHRIVRKYDCTFRNVRVTVSEDGECGATVFSEPMAPMDFSKQQILDIADSLRAKDKAKSQA